MGNDCSRIRKQGAFREIHMKDDDIYYAGLRPELIPFIPDRFRRVLEVGCGRGGFRRNLPPDVEVWGIEPTAEQAEVARQSLTRVLHGNYESVSASLPDRYFDLVICNDVIEHMPDDAAFLTSIRSKLATDGALMGSIPNMRHWPTLSALVSNQEWEYQDSGVLDRTHLRFYTIKSFPRLLERSGFTVQRFEGINRTMSKRQRVLLGVFNRNFRKDVVYMQFAFVARINSDFDNS